MEFRTSIKLNKVTHVEFRTSIKLHKVKSVVLQALPRQPDPREKQRTPPPLDAHRGMQGDIHLITSPPRRRKPQSCRGPLGGLTWLPIGARPPLEAQWMYRLTMRPDGGLAYKIFPHYSFGWQCSPGLAVILSIGYSLLCLAY